MKRSASLISLSALVHLCIIDALFFLLAPYPSLNSLVIISYNAIWLVIAFMIWHHSYDESRG
ncbi:hypothetical protein L1I30_10960 [Gillisia sp. M10.2A]|uniref:Uncharacterized protein n=1 Tax=Gillisia lutea TaxID=2909668 RepID=A0ABS9EJ32_9FLAO|nr:hypothetical protein [Gillisia lutea]MCF4102189.1 hypothetical protein [Gillisia lutea]